MLLHPITLHMNYITTVLKRNDVTIAFVTSSAADEPNLHRAILRLREKFEQLRRHLDEPKREAEKEKEGLKKNAEECEFSGGDSHEPQQPRRHAVSLAASSRSNTSPSIRQASPSTSSNALLEGCPCSSTQFNSNSVQAEEQAKEKRMENTSSHPTSQATHPRVSNGQFLEGNYC
ncbi:hypothetical protein BDN67DRAFT_708524 [Paxillus ammoniavirescens]|nr:hypothetical protein BDN67DRAFT_708524 [Paxillus ammoniavirescens]